MSKKGSPVPWGWIKDVRAWFDREEAQEEGFKAKYRVYDPNVLNPIVLTEEEYLKVAHLLDTLLYKTSAREYIVSQASYDRITKALYNLRLSERVDRLLEE